MEAISHLIWVISLALSACQGFGVEDLRPALAAEPGLASSHISHQQNQSAAQGEFRIQLNVDLVPIDVTVHGTPVRDLGAEDFLVYDNDIPRQVTYFSRGQLPLLVALVVDSSGSLTSYLPELESAARSALGSLKPEDQVVLFGFATFPARLSDPTQDHTQITRKLAAFTTAGSTNIWDAVFVAARYLRDRASDRRRAIILISDNGQIVNWGQTWKSALQETLEAGTILYAIETRGSGSLYAESDAVRRIAEDSGGEVLDVGAGRSLSQALHQSISNLRLQYTLGFSPVTNKDGSFHTLAVRLKNPSLCPDCRIHARKGYYAGTPAAAATTDRDRKTLPPGTRVEPFVYNRITIAVADMAELTEIAFEVKIASLPGPLGRLQTRLDLQIDPAGVRFKAVNGLQTAGLCIAVFSALADGVYYGTEWRTMDVQLNEDMYKQVLNSRLSYSTQIRGAPQMLKVVVYDLQGDKVGSKLVAMR